MRTVADPVSGYENGCKKEARAQRQYLKFIDENGGGPGVRLRKRQQKIAVR